MILYRISHYWNKIEEQEYLKLTPKFAVKANGRRDALISSSDSLHDTREQAVKTKRKQLEAEVSKAALRLMHTQDKLREFNRAEGL